jgi:hypothetical protein
MISLSIFMSCDGVALLLLGAARLVVNRVSDHEGGAVTAVTVMVVGAAVLAFPFTAFYQARSVSPADVVLLIVIAGIAFVVGAIALFRSRILAVFRVGDYEVPVLALPAVLVACAVAVPFTVFYTGPWDAPASVVFDQPTYGALIQAEAPFRVSGRIQGLPSSGAVWVVLGGSGTGQGLYFTTDDAVRADGVFTDTETFATTAASSKTIYAVYATRECDDELSAAREEARTRTDSLLLGALPPGCRIVQSVDIIVVR